MLEEITDDRSSENRRNRAGSVFEEGRAALRKTHVLRTRRFYSPGIGMEVFFGGWCMDAPRIVEGCVFVRFEGKRGGCEGFTGQGSC